MSSLHVDEVTVILGRGFSFQPPSDDRQRQVDNLECVARHLAVAASELSRDGSLPREELARFAAAEAFFRAQVAENGLRDRPISPWPGVQVSPGVLIPLVALFAKAFDAHWDPNRFPYRSIDRSLVLTAREFLCGVKWYLPNEITGSSVSFLF